MQRSGRARPPEGGPRGDYGELRPGEPQLFRREGDYWTITYGGVTVRLRDAVGIHYLAQLLTHPSQPIAVEELRATVRGDGTVDPERARWAVSKRIKDVLRRLEAHHPTLGHHLHGSIRTGAFCVYLPDPGDPRAWVT